MQAIRQQVASLLGQVLGRTLDPGESPARASEPGWDSIRHLELVFALEDAFEVRFDASELAGLDSLEGILTALERHLEA